MPNRVSRTAACRSVPQRGRCGPVRTSADPTVVQGLHRAQTKVPLGDQPRVGVWGTERNGTGGPTATAAETNFETAGRVMSRTATKTGL